MHPFGITICVAVLTVAGSVSASPSVAHSGQGARYESRQTPRISGSGSHDLAVIERRTFREGNAIVTETSPASCQATPVRNEPTGSGACAVVLFTAAHCVDDFALPQKIPGLTVTVGHLSIPASQVRVTAKGNLSASLNTKLAQRDDAALMSFTAPCDQVAFLTPVELAPTDENGVTVVGEYVWGKKRSSTAGANKGSGGQTLFSQCKVEEIEGAGRYVTYCPLVQAAVLEAGDSGAGFFDAQGRLVGALSGGEITAERGSRENISLFDATAIAWVKRTLGLQDGNSSTPLALLASAPTAAVSKGVPSAPGTASTSSAFALQSPPVPLEGNFSSDPHAQINQPELLPANPTVSSTGGRSIATGSPESVFPQAQPTGPNSLGTCPQCGKVLFRCARCGKVAHPGRGHIDPPEAQLALSALTPSGPGIGAMPGAGFNGNVRQAPRAMTGAMGGTPFTSSLSAPGTGPVSLANAMGITMGQGHDAITAYSNLRYMDGDPRERFPADMFTDIPQGGDGKITLAYFGAPRPDVERAAAGNPLVRVRRYDWNSPEGTHARLFSSAALAVDGLGRKITRYGMDPMAALQSLLSSNEIPLLRQHLAAQQPLQSAPVGQTTVPTGRNNHSGFGTESASALAITQPRHNTPINTAHLGPLLQGKCAQCHTGERASRFPEFLNDWSAWEARLTAGDGEARAWLQAFNSKVAHGEMLTHSGIDRFHGEGKALSDFIIAKHRQYLGSRDGENIPIGSAQAVAFVDPSRTGEYVEALKIANIPDAQTRRDLLEFDVIWDDVGNPKWSLATHGGDSGRKGLRPVSRQPASPVEPHLFKKENGVWSWKEPFDKGFALDSNSTGLRKFVTVRFPRDAQGNIIRGVKGTEDRPHSVSLTSSSGYTTSSSDSSDLKHNWASFPPGTKVFEVFYTIDGGQVIPLDVLTSEKRITADGGTAEWAKDSLRQDSSPHKIREWVRKQPNWETDPNYQRLLAAVDAPVADQVRSNLGVGDTGGTPFNVNNTRTGVIPGSKSVVTGVDPEILRRMYRELPMESALGSSGWALEASPMVSGTHRGIAINSKNCNNCHNNAGEKFADVFAEAGLPTGSVTAYGNAPGYDGVLSAPWNPRALATYGSASPDVSMDPAWSKFFEDFNPSRHAPERYRRVENLAVTPGNQVTLRGTPRRLPTNR